MTYDPDAPPPPYTPVDPLTPATSTSTNSPIQNQNQNQNQNQGIRLRGGGDVPAYQRLEVENGHPGLGEPTPISPTSNFSSATPYFEEHEAEPSNLPTAVVEHQLSVTPFTTAADVTQLPACWRSRAEFITASDLATFANYLFPPHLDSAHRVPRKIRAEADRHRKTGSQESDDERKERISATVAEWNEGFFGPRGVKINLSFSRPDSRSPSMATCPNCATELHLPQQPSTSSLPSYHSAPPPPAQRSQSWIQRFTSRAQSFGDLAESYGGRLERNAETYGRMIEGQAENLGKRVEAWGERVAASSSGGGSFRSGPFDEPRGRWGGRGGGWHRGGPFGGMHHGFGHHHHDDDGVHGSGLRGPGGGCGRHHRGRSWARGGHGHGHRGRGRDSSTSSSSSSSRSRSRHKHGHLHGPGRGRHHGSHGHRRRDSSTSSNSSTSSSSSSSSSSSDSSIDSIRSRDLENADLPQFRRSLATFRTEPHRQPTDLKSALDDLRQQLTRQRHDRGPHPNSRSSGFRGGGGSGPSHSLPIGLGATAHALKSEIKAVKREYREAVRQARREKRALKRERRNRRREAKRERRREKRERKREVKAGKRKVRREENGWFAPPPAPPNSWPAEAEQGLPVDRFADLSVQQHEGVTRREGVESRMGDEKKGIAVEMKA